MGVCGSNDNRSKISERKNNKPYHANKNNNTNERKKNSKIIKPNNTNKLNESKAEDNISNLKNENKKDDKKGKKNIEILNSKNSNNFGNDLDNNQNNKNESNNNNKSKINQNNSSHNSANSEDYDKISDIKKNNNENKNNINSTPYQLEASTQNNKTNMINPSNIPYKNAYLSKDKEKKKKEEIEQSNYCLFNSKNIQDTGNTQIYNEQNNSKNIAEQSPNNNNQNYSDDFVDGDMNNSQNNKDNKNKDSQLSNLNINNLKNNAIKNYEDYDINHDYNIGCPECKSRIPKIETIDYDSKENDFIITYICSCNKSNNKIEKPYFKELLFEYELRNNCIKHDIEELVFFCKDCNIQICNKCKEEEHQSHSIENNVNFISKENADKMLSISEQKKENFKGYQLIKKLYQHMIKNSMLSYSKNNEDQNDYKIYVSEGYAGYDNQLLSNNQNQNINENKDNKYSSTINYKCIKTLEGHEDKVVSLIQLNSGHIATGSYDYFVRIWDIETGKCILKFSEVGYVFCLLEFKPKILLTGTSENNIGLWDLNNPEESLFNFNKHILWVTSLVKCDDKYFASSSNDTEIIIWDYDNRKCIRELLGHIDCILTLIKLNNGNLCSGSADLTIKIWDWQKGYCIIELKSHQKWVKCLYQLKDGTLLSGSDDKKIKIWKNNECIGTIEAHELAVRSFCQVDDNHFASGSFDKTIKIWDINTLENVQTLKGHKNTVICIIKLKDNRLASCSNDKTIKIWE